MGGALNSFFVKVILLESVLKMSISERSFVKKIRGKSVGSKIFAHVSSPKENAEIYLCGEVIMAKIMINIRLVIKK